MGSTRTARVMVRSPDGLPSTNPPCGDAVACFPLPSLSFWSLIVLKGISGVGDPSARASSMVLDYK